jgi:hypothetical protein
MDYLLRELSTPRSIFYVNNIPSQAIRGDDIKHWSYEDVVNMLPQNLNFRREHPGDHINIWDFERLQNIGRQAGFSCIIRSKPGGSVSQEMQGPDMDKTHPQMTLYVDMVK